MWRLLFPLPVALTYLLSSAFAADTPYTPPEGAPIKFKPTGFSCASTTKWADGRAMSPDEQWKNYTQVQIWRMQREINAFCSSVPDEAILGGANRVHAWTTKTEPFDPDPDASRYSWRGWNRLVGGEDDTNWEVYAYGREKQYMCISAAINGPNTWSWSQESCHAILNLLALKCDHGTRLLKNGGKMWNDWMVWRVESFSEHTMPKKGPWSTDHCFKNAFRAREPPIAEEPLWVALSLKEF